MISLFRGFIGGIWNLDARRVDDCRRLSKFIIEPKRAYLIRSDKPSYQIRQLGHMYFPSHAFSIPGYMDVTRTMAEPITANGLAKHLHLAVSPALV
jgi:hypothetical protein